MSAHALAVMAAVERAEARRTIARNAPHFFVTMPDGRCNLCNLWTIGSQHLVDERHPLVAAVLAVRRHRVRPRLSIPLPPLMSQAIA